MNRRSPRTADLSSTTAEVSAAEGRRRLPAAERRRRLLEAAAEIFAERGFDVSTRDIAAHAGVTQALFYRYFDGKQALVTDVLEHVFADRFRGDWAALSDPADDRPFAERLVDCYVRFARSSDPVRMRLFIRAGLDGWSKALRRGTALTSLVFEPVIAGLRHGAGLPGFDTVPMRRGERELAMMLHGAVVFLAIRRHVYAMPMESDPAPVVEMQVRTFLAGAPDTLKRIHAAGDDDPLAVTLLTS